MTTANLDRSTYIIRGGMEGRERLRILSRVMQPTTLSLLHRVGVRPGMACLDAGSGGGDVSFDLARLTSPGGRVVGIDSDQTMIEMARRETAERKLDNAEFWLADIARSELEPKFDLVYARFLLTHLRDPGATLARLRRALRPGGVLVVEDIDLRGHFCHPDHPAFRRYVDLYTETVRRRGGDANIGLRLPELLTEAGFEAIEMHVVQPAGANGEVKLITPVTLENIRDAVLAEVLASRDEINQLLAELYEFACTPGTVSSVARVVQVWGYRPE